MIPVLQMKSWATKKIYIMNLQSTIYNLHLLILGASFLSFAMYHPLHDLTCCLILFYIATNQQL